MNNTPNLIDTGRNIPATYLDRSSGATSCSKDEQVVEGGRRMMPAFSVVIASLLLLTGLVALVQSEPNRAYANRGSDSTLSVARATSTPTVTPTVTESPTGTVPISATPAISVTPTISATPTAEVIDLLPFKIYMPIARNGDHHTFLPFMRVHRSTLPPAEATVQPTSVFVTQPTQMPAPPPIGTPTSTPTPLPLPTLSPSVTPVVTSTTEPGVTPTASPTGSTTMPTPSAEPPLGVKGPCEKKELAGFTQAAIVDQVKDNRGCAAPLVKLLIDDPETYLDPFYELVPSVEATEDLWFAVDTEMRAGNFVFEGEHIESLWANLPDAVAECTARRRCNDWEPYILVPLLAGEMYRCPELDTLDAAALLESVPYGNYFCTEETAAALALLADEETIQSLITLASDQGHGWSRRNALRILGRFAELGADNRAGGLVTETLINDVKTAILERLMLERDELALQDLIWLADSQYFPFFDAQPLFERLVLDPSLSDLTTFRAMAGITRLLAIKDGLQQRDLNFVLDQINAVMPFIRSQAARTFTVLESNHATDESQRAQIMAFLTQRLTFEENFMVEVALQEALDRYAGTNGVMVLRKTFEAANLGATLSEEPITIRSGLADEELPQYLTLMQQTESHFYETLGPPFDTPVEEDPTEAMTLLLFKTRPAYQEYMDAFVGFGSQAGGLYIERDATLYTYQRTAAESNFTIEHLVQHEFTHYLNGRYVFPNLWTDPGFHEQPKGWIDEGTGEYFGLTLFDEDGTASQPLADARLNTICAAGGAHSSLSDLINRRAGYDQPGVFDYDYAWAFMYYLFEQRLPVALRIFDEYRAETYAVDEFVSITGLPIDSLEAAWHGTMDGWCDSRNELQAAGLSTLGADHHSHESQILSHQGSIYTMPLPPVNATGGLSDEDEVIRLITSE